MDKHSKLAGNWHATYVHLGRSTQGWSAIGMYSKSIGGQVPTVGKQQEGSLGPLGDIFRASGCKRDAHEVHRGTGT